MPDLRVQRRLQVYNGLQWFTYGTPYVYIGKRISFARNIGDFKVGQEVKFQAFLHNGRLQGTGHGAAQYGAVV